MKTVINIAIFILFTLLAIRCKTEPPTLNCTFNIAEYKSELKQEFNADSVIIRTVIFKEEIYFPTLVAPLVSIYNPETETLNFKLLDEEKYKRFDNYEEIENGLKKEAESIAKKITETCEMSAFNDIMIEFAKSTNHEKFRYSFVSHF